MAQPAFNAPTLAFALHFAGQARRILPIPPRSKKPSLKRWPELATADCEVVSGWFRRNPDINYGILCDGASYHAARSARDRDRIRPQVLEDRGWTLHRIWSTTCGAFL